MNRRTALKSIAAALIAPTIRLRPAIDRERLLAMFCDPERGGRYDINQPFAHGSLTYATDAFHMARAELSGALEDGKRCIPDVEVVWRQYWHPSGCFRPLELPTIERLTLVGPKWGGVCPACGCRRVFFGNAYPQLDELERLERDYDYDVDSNTYRDPSCELCHGKPYHGPCELRICGVRMTYWRAKMLTVLPDVRVAGNAKDGGPLLFIADGFDGMSMGVYSE